MRISRNSLQSIERDSPDWDRYRLLLLQEFPGFDPEKSFSRPAERTCLLMMQNIAPVGALTLDRFENGQGAVRTVTIAAEHRGQGCGEAMGPLIECFARAQGIKKLCVNATNNTEGFYRKWGFSPEIWDANEAKPKNGVPVTQMTKTL